MDTKKLKQSETIKVLNAIKANDGGYDLMKLASHSLDICVQRVIYNYSGRGMYGDICVAFTVDDIGDAECIARQVSRLSEKAGKRVEADIDSLGLSFVVYCPELNKK